MVRLPLDWQLALRTVGRAKSQGLSCRGSLRWRCAGSGDLNPKIGQERQLDGLHERLDVLLLLSTARRLLLVGVVVALSKRGQRGRDKEDSKCKCENPTNLHECLSSP